MPMVMHEDDIVPAIVMRVQLRCCCRLGRGLSPRRKEGVDCDTSRGWDCGTSSSKGVDCDTSRGWTAILAS